MNLAINVADLLGDQGYSVTLLRTNDGGTYSTTTGAISGGASTTEAFTGLFIMYMSREVDGTAVRHGDRKLLLAARGTTMVPQPDDIVDGAVRIMDVQKLQNSSGVIAYVCQTRG